jgi:DNA-binding MarR family transcriptional regulator
MSGSRSRNTSSTREFSPAEYVTLAEFRYRLARFLRRRKDAARSEGLQAQQYELLLAVSGLPPDKLPTIKELASQLRLEHHTVVELADRLEKRGRLTRRRSADDRRVVLLEVTLAGQTSPDRVVRFSFSELRDDGPELIRALRLILSRAKRP